MQKDIALNRAASICSKSEKCIQDIRKKLEGWDISEEDTEEIIQKLIEDKFIDESRYVRFFVHDKFHFNRWGRIKIAYELRMRGITDSQIQTAFEQLKETEYTEALTKLLKDKKPGIKAKDAWDLRSKLLRFARSRGFETELALKIIDSFKS